MKLMFKITGISIICAITINCISFSTFALENSVNNVSTKIKPEQYVSEVYKPDSSYELKVQEKQRIAEKYYQAVVSGDIRSANKYMSEFESISNPVLYQSKLLQSETRTATYEGTPSSWRISGLKQVPQERNYWCGCAAAKSILDCIGIIKTQTQLASDTYLKTERFGSTPWYISNGNEFSQFPMATTLMNAQREVGNSVFSYVPSPLGVAGANPLTVEQCKSYVMSTTSAFGKGYGVAACGASQNVTGYRLPGYPASYIGHWIVSDGYKDNGNTIWIVDPAKSSAVSWSGSISAYYSIPATLFRNFIQPRGIIW